VIGPKSRISPAVKQRHLAQNNAFYFKKTANNVWGLPANGGRFTVNIVR
jgi:hypothetical protein